MPSFTQDNLIPKWRESLISFDIIICKSKKWELNKLKNGRIIQDLLKKANNINIQVKQQ